MADLNKNKAMIPMDCSQVVHRQTSISGFSSVNSTAVKVIDLSITNVIANDNVRPFNLMGEYYIGCLSSTISYNAPATALIYSLKCRLKFENNTNKNKFRFIRFSFNPNVTFKNTGVGINCKFGIDIYINIGNADKTTIKLESTNAISPGSSYTTGTYKFIYDVENNTIEQDIYE
jgi:hypothetical protein